MRRSGDVAEVRWPALPIAGAFTSAIVDVLGWSYLGHFYSANITGDLIQTAA